MISYSRNFLLSLNSWWKVFEPGFHSPGRHFVKRQWTRPVSPVVWNSLQAVGIVRRSRGKRGGQTATKVHRIRQIVSRERRVQTDFTSVVTDANRLPVYSAIGNNNITVCPKPSASSFPKLFLSNARSMVNKIDEICGSVTANLADIAVITESWLTSLVTDQLINIPGYATCRRDRPYDQRGGGLCTFISSRLDFIELCHLRDPDIESQWFVIKPNHLPRGINSIILGTVYHPPQNDDNKLRAHLFSSLDSALASYPNSAIVVLGDFNQFKPGNLCSSFKLKRLVTKPTRGNKILDQAYSTMSQYYDEALILPPVGLSDHSSVLLQPSNYHAPSLPATRVLKRDCKASNRQALLSFLQAINWTPLYHMSLCEDQFNDFQSTLATAMDKCLPMRSVKLHPTDKPWMTVEIKDAIKKRQRAWATGSSHLYYLYRNKVIKLCKHARSRFYRDIVSHMQDTNPKKWWSNIKLLSGLPKPALLSCTTIDGTFLRDTDLAEAINDSFSNVASDIPPLEFTPIPVHYTPDEYIISPEAVERSLLAIKERKSCGPDEIPNWVLKNFAPILCLPVCSIFNSSISQGHVPSLWKCANVLPLGKVPQPRSIDSDLRPISLTAVLSKVLEGFVFDWLAAVVMPHIDPFQFGCVKKSSTTHALVHLIHQWLAATESPKTVVRSCLIDFSKAFDRIDHNILLHKLQLLNVPPILLNWCAHFYAIVSFG